MAALPVSDPRIEDLKTDLAAVQALANAQQLQIELLRDENTALTRDLSIIAGRLHDEAEEREWCEEYNDFVSVTNRSCTQPRLEPLVYEEDDDGE
jgi:hypothetical protein